MGQKLTYTQLVFGSIAFKMFNLGQTRLAEVYNFVSEVLADFLWFSHDAKQRGTEFEGRPWNTSTGVSEASKAMTSFSGIFQAV